MTDNFADFIDFGDGTPPRQPRPTYEQARAARDAGIDRASGRAERVEPGWAERAFDWIVGYAKANKTFISEDCTAAAVESGLPAPPDARAWGGPFQRASREQIIRRIGYGTSKRRHLSPTPLWESLLT